MLELCRSLENNDLMKNFHDQCHFIVWNEKTKIQINIYRQEVCNSKIFGLACGLLNEEPDTSYRVKASQFINDFFEINSNRTLSINDFEMYLEWLLNITSRGYRTNLELITYDERTDDYALVQFSTVRAAYDWLQARR